jgi:hypothetical protein
MAQSNEPEFYQEVPDRPSDTDDEIGIRSSAIGSFMPVGSYRPVPIVHFAGTLLLQILALMVLFGVLYAKAGIFTIAASTVVTIALGKRAFDRWLGETSTAWKIATVAVLALNLLIVTLGCLER